MKYIGHMLRGGSLL